MQKAEGLHSYIISIGSNAPDAYERVKETAGLLKSDFVDSIFSGIIQTRGVDVDVACFFQNAVALVKTAANPDDFKIHLKNIEKKMGRSSHLPFVLIDIDIIVINNHIVHPDFQKRKYIRELLESLPIKKANIDYFP
jgi:2-amino-4-hydroxy-6-hydroxymethyldihydropteridine diphosphokinase